MSEEEREKIKERIKELIRLLYRDDLSQFGKRNLETYINKLMEETGKVKQLEKENEALKEENIILEGNKIGYKLAIQELRKENQELEKTIDLMATELSRRPLMIYLDNERDDRLVILDNPKEIIKYYTKKAEEENE